MDTRAVAAVALLAVAAVAPTGAHEPEDPMTPVAWLAGCWQHVDGAEVTHEQWMRPLGGAMVGMSRTVAGGRAAAFEHLRLEDRDGTLVYTAWPSGQRETAFRMTRFGPTWVELANPEHDFPRLIRYALAPDGSLEVRLEGSGEPGPRVVELRFQRVDCP